MSSKKQKEADEYNNIDRLIDEVEHRVLTRPATTMKHVWACLIILTAFYLILGIGVILIPLKFWYKLLIFVSAFILFNEFFLRYFGIVLVKCYQHYASDEMRSTCHCVPSCSEYSILVLKKYPLIIAFCKIYKRLNKTCNGDYKEDYP